MNTYPFYRVSSAIAALPLLAMTISATPAQAVSGTAGYRAELASPLAEPRQEIVDSVVWQCEGTSCAGTKSGSRPVIVCGRLAQKLGPVTRFAHAKGELDAKDLARCNGG
jgi:hypothetical protein